MDFAAITVLAQAEEEGGGNFLVSPNVGIMIWTLLAFGITLFVLWKFAFPAIGQALDKRQKAIEEAIDASERTKAEADELLAEYRERLKEARVQAEEIIARARKAGEVHERESLERFLEDEREREHGTPECPLEELCPELSGAQPTRERGGAG